MQNIRKICSEILKVNENEIIICERLELGMSNLIYRFECQDKEYTIRIPGSFSEVFVDRLVEEYAVRLVEAFDINTKTIYFDSKTGYKISKYISGRVLAYGIADDDYVKVANVLRKLHYLKTLDAPEYNPFQKLAYFESLLDKNVEPRYVKVKNELNRFKAYLEKQEKVFAHNDSQPSNFIMGDNNHMYLVDYEFAGMNDPIYDMACFGNNDIENGKKLLNYYFMRDANNNEMKRYYLWRTFQCLQWFCVATHKHTLGIDSELSFNFIDVAYMFLNLAEEAIKNEYINQK